MLYKGEVTIPPLLQYVESDECHACPHENLALSQSLAGIG